MRRAATALLLVLACCRDPAPSRDAAIPDASVSASASAPAPPPAPADAGSQGYFAGRLLEGRLARPIQQIASGGTGTLCALDAEGRVGCYGNPLTWRRFVWPAFSFGPVAEISVLHDLVCARSREGAVECLRFKEDQVAARWMVPVQGARQIASGTTAICALLGDEAVRCWPWGRTVGRSGDEAPLSITGLSHPRRISPRPCAIDPEGHVACARVNVYLRDPPSTSAAERAGTLSDVVEIADDRDTICAVRRDGSLWCWGSNDAFKLAHEPQGTYPLPLRVGGLASVTHVAIGGRNACAIDREGGVFCWGLSRGMGIPGPCKTIPPSHKDVWDCAVSEPRRIPFVPRAQQIEVGDQHACVIGADGDVYCWGADPILRGDDSREILWKVPW